MNAWDSRRARWARVHLAADRALPMAAAPRRSLLRWLRSLFA